MSAGILLYRRAPDGRIEVLLGHPGGPYFATKDEGHWSIPKGEVDDGEDDLRLVALREFEEETGHPVGTGPDALEPLGEIVQKGGKHVVAWAAEGDLDPVAARSNAFSVEWPPRSGRFIEVPEIDRVAWFAPEDARRTVKPTQIPFIDRLEARLTDPGAEGSEGAGRAGPATTRPRDIPPPLPDPDPGGPTATEILLQLRDEDER